MSRRYGVPVLLAAGMACGALSCGALAASTGTTISAPLPADALPVPPPKAGQFQALQGFAPAPVPDPDLQRPRADVLAEQPHTKVVPSLFDQSYRRSGDGYVKGSAGEYDTDRRFRASPGINLRVPLQ